MKPIAAILTVLLTARAGAQDTEDAASVRRFAARWCADCHGGAEPEAGLDLTRFPESVASPAATLANVARRLRAREMPPEGAARPGDADVAALLARIEAIERPASRPETVTIRRLSRYEYRTTIRDLLGVEAPADDFPVDDVSLGFDNIGDVLGVPPLLFEKYAAAAEEIAREAIVDEDPANPPRTRVEARAMSCSLPDSFRGSFRVLFKAGQAGTRIAVGRDGVFRLLARVYGDQAGPEAVKAMLYAGREKSEPVEVAAMKDAPVEIGCELRLSRGVHTIAIAFINDHYAPDAPDPAQRDRNLAVEWLEIAGPVDARALPRAHREILAADPGRGDEAARLRAVLSPLVLRAWRRPPEDAELERLARLGAAAIDGGARFERGVQVALQAILLSPHFLFRVEQLGGEQALTPWQLATRLSYFLWSSMPDERLFDLAASGALDSSDALRAEADRMLGDARASALAENFAAQWLELRNLDDAAPDPGRFPDFDEELREAMRRETELLFEAVLRERRPLRELVDAPFTFVNERLARHYGIPGVRGPHFRRVRPPADRGGGVLAHASILTVTSNATRTSPVKRGKFVLDNLLDAPPPPPPPGVGALDEDPEAVRGATIRERMERHRTQASCAACHARIDALGLSLEHYDPIGAWRNRDESGPVDPVGTLPDGRPVDGLDALRLLVRDDGALVRSLARKLFIHAVGRDLAPADERALRSMVDGLPSDATIRDVVLGIVGLDAFRAP